MLKKSAKPSRSPDKLTKTRKPTGIVLTESQLGQATGGAKTVKIDFGG